LPWVYVTTALLFSGLAWLARHADRKLGRHALSLTLLGAAGVMALAALHAPSTAAGVFAFYIAVAGAGTAILVRTWTMIDGLFSLGDARRAFAPIATGGGLGAIAGGLLAKRLAHTGGAPALIGAAAIILALTSVVPLLLHRARIPATLEVRDGRLRNVLGATGVRRLLSTVILLTIASTIGDYLFKRVAADHVSTRSLTSFFATYNVIMSAAALAVQAFVAPLVLRKLGERRSVLVLPALTASAALGFTALPGFTAAIIMKSVDAVLRGSLHRPASEVLYVPLAMQVRARAKALVDGVWQRGGQALASLSLMSAQALGARVHHLSVLVVVAAVLGVVAAHGLGRTHVRPIAGEKTLNDGLEDHTAEKSNTPVGNIGKINY
jgi:AAA family ATP:ADP antiporter